MAPLYIINHRFGPWHGDRWHSFISWSGLTQLQELISLDDLLCPALLNEIKDEFWPYIVNDDFMLRYFTDLEFMLTHATEITDINILCVFRNPTAHPMPPKKALAFEFVGYDLIDEQSCISSLSNCTGFSKAFSNDDLNKFGLLNTHEAAVKAQASLLQHYPHDNHAYCDRWAMFRSVEPYSACQTRFHT